MSDTEPAKLWLINDTLFPVPLSANYTSTEDKSSGRNIESPGVEWINLAKWGAVSLTAKAPEDGYLFYFKEFGAHVYEVRFNYPLKIHPSWLESGESDAVQVETPNNPLGVVSGGREDRRVKKLERVKKLGEKVGSKLIIELGDLMGKVSRVMTNKRFEGEKWVEDQVCKEGFPFECRRVDDVPEESKSRLTCRLCRKAVQVNKPTV